MSQTVTAPVEAASKPNLSELSAQTLYDKCVALAHNLWWSWHAEVINLFRDLDPIRWRQLDHNPIALLAEFTPERLEMRAAELVLYSRINQAYRRLKEYMSETPAWGRTHAGVLGSQAGGLFLRSSSASTSRCRSIPAAWACSRATTSRAPAGWACRWWPSACSTTRAISSSTSTSTAISSEEYLDTKVENLPMEPARDRRRQADHRPDRHPHRQAAGQGLADARGPGEAVSAGLRRATATAPRTAS